MSIKKFNQQWKEIKRGSEEIIPEESLREKILAGQKLKVKFGIDPTTPDLHLGHTVVMEKLSVFQKQGHQIILIIGDFTAAIGDPSGRTRERPVLSKEEIKENVKSFEKHIFKILKKKNLKIVKNSKWLEELGGRGIIKLASNCTVARMLERSDFSQRYQKGNAISITEFLYPLLQAYDSFAIKADVEIGGTDQKFNLLLGRHVQQALGGEPQAVLTMPLLEGTDGVRKMSKSYANHIGINEKPEDFYGKVMSVSDEMMFKYYTLLTGEDIEKVKRAHPMEAKKALAFNLVEKYHGREKACEAEKYFENVFSKGKQPGRDKIKEYELKGKEKLVDIIKKNSMASSKGEAKRLMKQGGVKLNDEKVMDINYSLAPGFSGILKVGKRSFLKIV
ncbi:MAG: tyrosine--tRNA ligase [Elusimicrobiota bacterium]